MLKKIALTLFLVITLAVIAILAIASTRPATYHVERSISTAAPPPAVFGVLDDLHRFREWSPWEKLDPKMKVTYAGPETGVGSSYAWEGNSEAGSGRMTITETTPPNELILKLEFLKPFESTCALHYKIAPENEGSRVTWSMDGNNNFVGKVMCLFGSMDKMMGGDFERGLASLKQVTETAAAAGTPASAETGTTTTAKP